MKEISLYFTFLNSLLHESESNINIFEITTSELTKTHIFLVILFYIKKKNFMTKKKFITKKSKFYFSISSQSLRDSAKILLNLESTHQN